MEFMQIFSFFHFNIILCWVEVADYWTMRPVTGDGVRDSR